ncbi:hypothetical protein [Roseicyclus sp.]|uniref:hypothetical protein n=1 Tax=Roseicyclus sp. TaxID=1914329 RepID=UPI003FA15C01
MRFGNTGALAVALTLAGGAAMAEEGLRAGLPEGFVLGFSAGEGGDMIREYLRAGETLEAWSDLVTVQRFAGLAGVDPLAYVEAVAANLREVCPDARVTPPDATMAGPYRSAAIMARCPVSPRTGATEVFAMRAFAGAQAMHVVQYAWTRDPDPAEIDAAIAFISDAVLCDPTRSDAPCPAGGHLP